MDSKKAANKALDNAYRGGVEKAIADRDKRTGADTQRQSILIPAEETERRRAEAAALEAQMQAKDAEQAREKAAAAEADFRATELQRYIAAGGSQSDFNEAWPRLRQQIIEQRYLSQPDRSTSGAAKRYLDLLYGKRD
jgi:hypothetical protein